MATEQQYYEFLTRTQHPVFIKDLAGACNSTTPFNIVRNRLVAKQLVRMEVAVTDLQINSFPNTVTDEIDQWEDTYFGFTKAGYPLSERVAQLLQRFNNQIFMSVPSVIEESQQITGQTPIVIRSLFFGGWTLDVSALDVDTIFAGTDQSTDAQTYIVVFSQPVDSSLLQMLDNELTIIEKGGSTHIILSPVQFWTFDLSALDIDTVLE